MSKRITNSSGSTTNSANSQSVRENSRAPTANPSSSRSAPSASALGTRPNPLELKSLHSSSSASASSSSGAVAAVVIANERSNEVPPSTISNTESNQNSSEINSNTAMSVTPRTTTAADELNSEVTINNNTNSNQISKSDSSIFQRIKKRTITGVLSSEADAEFTCPICFDMIDIAHVTRCGHSFCQICIQTALGHTHRCPKCNTPCSINKDVFPNFTLNQIIERYKEETNTKKCKFSKFSSSSIIDYINSAQEELNIEDVNHLLKILSQRKEELKYTNKKITELLIYDFLKHLQQVKIEELQKVQHELQMVNEDCKQVEEVLNSLQQTSSEGIYINIEDLESPKPAIKSSENALTSGNECQIDLIGNPEVLNDDLSKSSAKNLLSQTSPNKLQTILTSKKRKLHRYFDEISQTYVKAHNRDSLDFNIKDCTKNSSQVLDQIRETVSKITSCSELKCIASVNYGSDVLSMSSIVSSVDFDRSYEHFAMAGVTKRLKIFDFNTILERPYNVHYPLYEIVHSAKLSCVSWNRYFRQQLACSDYEGAVTLWDAESGSLLRSYQEHERRCWGVQFCNVDPRLLASASDDSKVKIWSTNSDYSILTIDAKSNVCCVAFKPDSKFHVLFGTSDHCIHYYDLRYPKEAVSLFNGHKKAVSYVKFSSENEFVSASTDSNLKTWKLGENQCIRSFKGHINEKNFVGLETHNGYILTGSENNTCYLYSSELSKPLLTYKFDENTIPKKDEIMNDFVSAVCWSNQNYVLAANSQGVVKVLELI